MILPRRACLAVIELALLVAPVSARRTRPVACGGGAFTIAATDATALAALVGGDVGTFSFGPGSTVALATCTTMGHVKAKRRATLVKARFAKCGIGVKAKLAVTMPAPDCGTAHGTFKVKGKKRVRFTAVRTTTGSTTTTTLPGGASCGNGIVDPGEMCEGLTGCGPATRCTANCTCEPEPAMPPTSQTLIAAALAAGTIDYSTSLVDRAYALFGDSRLPPEYDGQLWRSEDQGLFLEASGAWGSLTPEARTALTPFLVRPTDPQSIYFPPPASTLLVPRAVGVRLEEANCPFVSGAAFPDWRSTESGHFVVWSCGGGDLAQDPDAALRTIVSGVAEQAWSAITPEAVAPRPDGFMSGPAPQDRIDVYIVHGATCKDRQGACVPIETDEDGRRPLASVVATSPCDRTVNGALTSSAFMLVDADSITPAPASGPWKFRYVFAHEFFHVVADAMNLEAQGGGCFDVANPSQVFTSWLTEASAEWAAWAFFGDDGPDERTNLFLAFQEFRPPPAVSLLSVDGQRPYEAFLYPFFLQQENGGSRAPFLTMWKSSGSARRPEDLDDRLDQSLAFDGHFRDFTVRNFNKTVELPPSESHYQGQDSAIPANESPNLIEPTLTLAQPGATVSPGANLQPLTAQYQRYVVTDAVRYVRIDAGPLGNSGFVDLDALANVRGTWKRRKGKGGVLELCRDDPADDVQELYLVVTNHDRKRGRTVTGHYDVRMGATCPAGWSGSLKYVYSDGDAGATTYGSAYYTKDDHFRTEDTWTLGATTPGTPPDSFDTVDAVWTGSINVTALDTYTPIPPNGCVGYETLSSSAAYSGSGTGPQQFQVIPSDADPNQVYLSAVLFASQNSIMASGVEDRVQCNLGPSTHPLSSMWSESIGQLQSGLPLLVPDPADPDHYAGTVTLTHSVKDGIEVGSHVTDETVEWDLRRRRQATP